MPLYSRQQEEDSAGKHAALLIAFFSLFLHTCHGHNDKLTASNTRSYPQGEEKDRIIVREAKSSRGMTRMTRI